MGTSLVFSVLRLYVLFEGTRESNYEPKKNYRGLAEKGVHGSEIR
jgi:hypothetical protein